MPLSLLGLQGSVAGRLPMSSFTSHFPSPRTSPLSPDYSCLSTAMYRSPIARPRSPLLGLAACTIPCEIVRDRAIGSEAEAPHSVTLRSRVEGFKRPHLVSLTATIRPGQLLVIWKPRPAAMGSRDSSRLH
jgi:hypothetical protein